MDRAELLRAFCAEHGHDWRHGGMRLTASDGWDARLVFVCRTCGAVRDDPVIEVEPAPDRLPLAEPSSSSP